MNLVDELRQAVSLSDLVVELSHFIDSDTVRKVELKFLEDSLKEKFRLDDDFELV